MRNHPTVAMRAGDLGELYTYLKLFGQIYTDCERERQILEQGIEEVFRREYGSRDGCQALQAMRNPRKAGRRRKNGPEAQEQIKALLEQGKSIREISAETGIPKSTVQRLNALVNKNWTLKLYFFAYNLRLLYSHVCFFVLLWR